MDGCRGAGAGRSSRKGKGRGEEETVGERQLKLWPLKRSTETSYSRSFLKYAGNLSRVIQQLGRPSPTLPSRVPKRSSQYRGWVTSKWVGGQSAPWKSPDNQDVSKSVDFSL